MSARSLVIGVHVALSCGATLAWFAAWSAHVAPWRRHHALLGKVFLVLVVASSVLAAGLATESRNRFGVLFSLQPLLLALSAAAQFLRSRLAATLLAGAGVMVAAGVLEGFVRLLATRDLIDVVAFAGAALVAAALAIDDLRAFHRPPWRAHAYRMLAAGWFYVAELGIFVFDPHPSLIAWAFAAVVPAAVVWWMHRQPGRRAVAGHAHASQT